MEPSQFSHQEQTLREPHSIRSKDIRSVLGIAPATLNDLYKKIEVPSSKSTPKQRGTAIALPGPDARKVFEARGFAFPEQGQVVTMMMSKGGVGKTTSTFFLSQRLSAYGARVLVIDADPQGNLTSAFGLEDYNFEVDEETPVLVDVIAGETTMDEAIIQVTPNLALLPSSPMNSTLDSKIRDKFKHAGQALEDYIPEFKKKYDFILIDCAPSFNLTNTAVGTISDLIILPVAPDKFSKIGVEQTLSEIRDIRRAFRKDIRARIIFTKFDAREYTSLHYLSEIATEHKDIMFKTMIRTASDLKNAITKHEDLFDYKKSNAKEDYDAFAIELLGLDELKKKGK